MYCCGRVTAFYSLPRALTNCAIKIMWQVISVAPLWTNGSVSVPLKKKKRRRGKEKKIPASLSVYLNSTVPLPSAPTVRPLCHTFGAVFDQTCSSPKILVMALLMAKIRLLLQIVIVNHRPLKSPGSV